jgi:hypothetical protein
MGEFESPSAADSTAYKTFRGRQAGYVSLNGAIRASIWSSTAQSWEDLSVFLPSTFRDCYAYSVWDDGRTLYVGGAAREIPSGIYWGVLWKRPLCRADFNYSGRLEVQDLFDFLGAWFAGDPRADFNGRGLHQQDIFDYLAAWFAGC